MPLRGNVSEPPRPPTPVRLRELPKLTIVTRLRGVHVSWFSRLSPLRYTNAEQCYFGEVHEDLTSRADHVSDCGESVCGFPHWYPVVQSFEPHEQCPNTVAQHAPRIRLHRISTRLAPCVYGSVLPTDIVPEPSRHTRFIETEPLKIDMGCSYGHMTLSTMTQGIELKTSGTGCLELLGRRPVWFVIA